MTDSQTIVITYPYPLGARNGGARLTREIALSLAEQGHTIYLLPVSASLKRGIPRSEAEAAILGHEYDAGLEAHGGRVVRIPPSRFHAYGDGLHVRRALQDLLANTRVDAVLGFYHEAIFLPRLLRSRNITFGIIAAWQSYARAMRLPSKRRHLAAYLSTRVKRQQIIRTYRQADHLFAISDHTGRELIEHVGVNPERVTTCYLGVAPRFAQLPRPEPEKIQRFIFFGRLVPSKGVADAIQALACLKERGFEDWELHINGEGNEPWVREEIQARGLAKQISVHCARDDGQLLEALAGAHLAILPSHLEAFGLVFAEAQAAGLPVVGYAAGSVPEIVNHGETGLLAPAGDVGQLAEYVLTAAENPAQTYRMGLAGRQRITRLFTWERAAATISTELQRLRAQQRA